MRNGLRNSKSWPWLWSCLCQFPRTEQRITATFVYDQFQTSTICAREVANEDLLRQILSFPLIFPSLSLPKKSRLNPTLMVTRKKQNDHQLWKKLLIFEQILLVSSLRNVRRLCILMLECKGLINTWLKTSRMIFSSK